MAATVFQTYSFLDVQATIVGPNITQTIGSTAGNAEEGISVAFNEDQVTQHIGADGSGMTALHAGQSGAVVLRLLKSSPVNSVLQSAYAADRAVPSNTGQNTIVISWLAGGDVYNCQGCAFRKFPDNTFAKDANTLEWSFVAIFITPLFGRGD